MKYQFEWGEIKTCWSCPIMNLDSIECPFKRSGIVPIGGKPNWCLLREVQDE